MHPLANRSTASRAAPGSNVRIESTDPRKTFQILAGALCAGSHRGQSGLTDKCHPQAVRLLLCCPAFPFLSCLLCEEDLRPFSHAAAELLRVSPSRSHPLTHGHIQLVSLHPTCFQSLLLGAVKCRLCLRGEAVAFPSAISVSVGGSLEGRLLMETLRFPLEVLKRAKQPWSRSLLPSLA